MAYRVIRQVARSAEAVQQGMEGALPTRVTVLLTETRSHVTAYVFNYRGEAISRGRKFVNDGPGVFDVLNTAPFHVLTLACGAGLWVPQ